MRGECLNDPYKERKRCPDSSVAVGWKGLGGGSSGFECGSYIMWWWTKGAETEEKDVRLQKSWRKRGGGILLPWQIDVIHLSTVTPPAHSPSDQHTPKGKSNYTQPPCLFVFLDNVCPLLQRRSKQTKWQLVVICIALFFPFKITRTHTDGLFSLQWFLYRVRWSDFPSSLLWFLAAVGHLVKKYCMTSSATTKTMQHNRLSV